MGEETVVLDFPKRIVREPIDGEGKYRYGFRIAPELVRTVLRDDEPDWVNTIFLSTRFTAWRIGGYNEFLYTFFKCLTDERIAYADGWFAEAHDDSASIELGGYEIQRRCPPTSRRTCRSSVLSTAPTSPAICTAGSGISRPAAARRPRATSCAPAS